MFEPLNPDAPLALLIRHWGPPLITIVIGGLFASILFPRWQAAQNRARGVIERRFEMTEALASAFTRYITEWRRLIDIATLASERDLTDVETARLNGFAAARNDARDALFDLCARGQLYFSDDAVDLIAAFQKWDSTQAAKRLEDLPKPEEWRAWESRVLRALKRDLDAG